MQTRTWIGTFAVVLMLAPAARAQTGLHAWTGALHGHSAYSDGYTGSRPADAFASARSHGNDFFGMSDHSDTLDVPISASGECIDPSDVPTVTPACAIADQVHPEDSFRKWDATAEHAQAATTPFFTGMRGFEWTSDRFGHINVYFSSREVNAKIDGGYADMGTFYSWLTRPLLLGGGSDGLATFNHPGDKKLSTSDPAYNWNDFAYAPAADDQMVGIEVYNSASDFGSPHQHGSGDDGWYAHALDKGWHVGAIGAEDLGHHRGDDWGGPGQAKTVILAPDRSPASLRAAMHARRFYAVRRPGWHLSFTIDGARMGARLVRPAHATLRVAASVSGPQAASMELITSGGKVVERSTNGRLHVDHRLADGERWFFVRAMHGNEAEAFSSPVWIGAQPARQGMS